MRQKNLDYSGFFCYQIMDNVNNMDKLKECAISFQKLCQIQYFMKAGSKGKLIEFTLEFKAEHFYHLIGLHKLTDIPQLKGGTSVIFNLILNDEITYSDISKSSFFDEINKRIEYFCQLEKMLDNNEIIISFNANAVKGSRINADYLIYLDSDIVYHFFASRYKDKNKNKVFGRSFFVREDNNYINGQRKYKVICKEKINLSTNTRIKLK